ncbi:P-loop NTPase [Natrialbaceae archaeon GCM10025810]|uniref:P-loop NTPase n=1 Tax=Halovalidus salilacus TaxID=3075124 RepID=UPI00361EE391
MTDETPRTDDEVRRAVVDRIREVRVGDGDPISGELLEEVDVSDGVVTFTVDFARLDRGMAERVTDQLRGAGLATRGVDHVRLEAADAEAPETGIPVTGAESLIAVASAKGGVGKTTVTVALVRALSEAGLNVGVFDANVHAPDAPALLGATGPVRASPTGRPIPVEVDGVQVVSIELIAEDGPNAWRGAMVHDVVTDLLGNAAWEDRDVLLIDLPPGIGDGVYTVVQQAPLDGALFVSTPTDASARATNRSASLFEANGVETIGVVPNMAGATADGGATPFESDSDDARALAEAIDDDAYAAVDPIPFDPALRDPMDLAVDDPETDGELAVASLAETVRSFVAERGESRAPEDAVDLRGLPPKTSERQALTELDAAAGEDISLLVRGEPNDLVETLEDTLVRDGRTLERADVDDLGREGWLLRLRSSSARSEATV